MEKQRAKRLLLNSSENEELVGSGQKPIRKQIGVFELSANHDSGQPIYKNEVSFDVLESAVASDFSSTIANREPSKKWMAFERSEPNDKPKITNPTCNFDNPNGKLSSTSQIEANIAERTAEWGLVVKTDVEGGFKVSTMDSKLSGDGEIEKEKLSDRFLFGLESTRTSEESNSFEGGFPRVSQELKDALETLQQTFVVSDATEPDCPIIYASSGFFSMTGYSSKDIIRFLQGPETDQNEVAKIKNSVMNGTSYCGRLLNYKKDGTPFWNLLTITPIKDDRGNTIKFIGMQVEVSKCTEEVNDKALRPNGLPKSSIRYDARQKAKALMSMDEVIQTVKHPRSHIRDMSNDINGKHEEQDRFNLDYVLPESADAASMSTAGRKTPQFDSKSDVSCVSSSQDAGKQLRKSARISLMGFKGRPSSSTSKPEEKLTIEPEILKTNQVECTKNWELSERESDIRKGIDLATMLERIEKNFVISDPRLPDNPIIYASDSFLELTGYTREEILGRNCRFLQGTETDQVTVSKIRDAIREQGEITVQLINYTKSGKKFWNLFHLQPMRDQMGELQYFIGVQLDGSCQVEPLRNCLSEKTEQQSAKLVKATAVNVDEAVRELPDANLTPEDLWAIHYQPVFPRPHKKDNSFWIEIQKITARGEKIGIHNFKPVKPLGCGDTGSVHLVELQGTGELYAMKAMKKSMMLSHNKVHRACIEREIISLLDHPFLPTLYSSFQTSTHVCLITDFCAGGELFALLDKQPMKIFKEESARFYAAEVAIVLEYLHCLGIIYRDLKPENILLQKDGHIVLTDFDLSFMATCKPKIIKHSLLKNNRRSRSQPPPLFVAEPINQSNSFVGTEEYIAPEIITGAGHSSAIDWWALGILLYEMLYGRTPFRGKNRQKTFANILYKDLTFPSSIQVSLTAKQLINSLLQRDPSERLGSNTGANEIKQHPFFRRINWPLIRCMSPPPLDVPLELIGKVPGQKM